MRSLCVYLLVLVIANIVETLHLHGRGISVLLLGDASINC